MVAGQLEIDLVANVARLVQDMQKVQSTVGSAMQNVERAVGKVTAAFGALGVGLSVGAMVLFADRTLNAIARMKDLAQEAGTTASAISKFEAPARIAGSSIDTVATAMFRMNKAALEGKDPATASAQALAAIGISSAQIKNLKPDEMFELIARRLANYSDGLAKNSVMQQLFGKSGKELNGIMAAIAEQSQLTATVSDEQAAAAKRLEEQIVELKMTSDKFWRSLVSDAVPALNDILKSFMEARKEGGLLQGIIQGLATAFENLNGKSLADQLKQVNEQIDIAKRAAEIQGGKGGFFDFNTDANAAAAAKLNGLLKQRADIEHLIFQQELDAQDKRALAGLTPGKPDPKFDPAAIAAAKAAEDAYKSLNAQLDKEIATLRGIGEQEAFNEKLEEARFANISGPHKQELRDKEALLIALKNEAIARDLIIKSSTAEIEAMQKLHDLDQSARDASREQTEQMTFQISLIGKTAEEQDKLNALHQIDLDTMKQIEQVGVESGDGISAAQTAEMESIRAINEARKQSIAGLMDQKAAAEAQLSVWSELGDAAGRFFGDLVTNGGSAIDKLKQFFKSLLADMIRIFAQRWILNMAAGGTVMGSAGSALAGGGGSNSLAGAAVNYVGNQAMTYVGGAAMTAAFGGEALGAGAAAGGAFAGATAGAAGSVATAGALSGVYTALAAIPVWGWIAMAVIAIGAWIAGSHKGGPKVGGSFMGDYDASGNLIGSSAVPGSDNGRFFTPDQMDSQMKTLADATAKGFAGTLLALGGKSAGFSFGLGADNDPQGTAQSRVSAMLRNAAGRVIYSNLDQNMDDKSVAAALQLESSRMIMAALKASDLPSYLQHVFDNLTPSSATQDQIDTAIKQALALKDIFDVVTRNPLEDMAKGLTDALNPLATAMRTNEAAIRSAMGAYDGSAAATDLLRTNTIAYYNAQVQLLAGITQIKNTVDDMFGATFRNIQMAGMTSQGKYNFLQAEALSLQGQALTSTDPETIRQLSQRINDDISAAFGLLSPGEQAAQSGAFLSRGQATQAAIDARLEALQKDAADATQKVLDEIRELIGANKDSEREAAAEQKAASSEQLAAARTPRVIVLQLPTGQQTVTFSDGG